jgi:hypothetical protein
LQAYGLSLVKLKLPSVGMLPVSLWIQNSSTFWYNRAKQF